jgi:hypothetical protein
LIFLQIPAKKQDRGIDCPGIEKNSFSGGLSLNVILAGYPQILSVSLRGNLNARGGEGEYRSAFHNRQQTISYLAIEAGDSASGLFTALIYSVSVFLFAASSLYHALKRKKTSCRSGEKWTGSPSSS